MNWLITLLKSIFGSQVTESPSVVEKETEKKTVAKQPSKDAPTGGPKVISQEGLELIKKFEGLYLNAYKDAVGVVTIGYGHTGIKHNDGTVKMGQKITKERAEELLSFDMGTKYGPDVNRLVKVPLLQREFDALVSFHFNTGALGKSTLLKKLNAGDKEGASNEFLKWVKAGGKTLRGLVRRRDAERAMFRGEDWRKF